MMKTGVLLIGWFIKNSFKAALCKAAFFIKGFGVLMIMLDRTPVLEVTEKNNDKANIRKNTGEKMRIQFELTDEKAKELDEFMSVLGVTTKKDLFENALSLLEWATKEIINNPDRVIGSIDEKTDRYKELQMSVFSNARSHAKARLTKTA
jgi:hypothetical protein